MLQKLEIRLSTKCTTPLQVSVRWTKKKKRNMDGQSEIDNELQLYLSHEKAMRSDTINDMVTTWS